MRVISIVNQKGGCGKTTTAINLASALSCRGRKVLLIDLDPQSHSGLSFGIDVENLEFSIYHVMKEEPGQGLVIDDILVEINENLYIAPSTVLLCAIEQELSGLPGREFRLTEQLDSLRQPFDYTIIDCPPSIGLLTFNALTASHEVIIPIDAGIYSIHGVSRLLDELDLVEKNLNRPIDYTVIQTMYDHRMKFSRKIYKELEGYFGDRFMPAPIHHSVKVREAVMTGIPLNEYAPDCQAFRDYLEIADHILSRESEFAAVSVEKFASTDLAPTPVTEGVKFSIYAPRASSVKVAGDFNVWNPEQGRMQMGVDGVWTVTLPIPPGKHNYKFILDGNWIVDPNNPDFEKDVRGNVNSIIDS